MKPYRYGTVIEWDGGGFSNPRWFIVCGEPHIYTALWLGDRGRGMADGKTHHIGANHVNENVLSVDTNGKMVPHTRRA